MDRKDWIGIDASLEISLFEYGLLVCHNHSCENDDEWFCLVGVESDDSGNFTKFSWGYLRNSELIYDWMDIDEVAKYSGLSAKEWLKMPFIQKLSDLLKYYGNAELGFESYDSFPMKEEELDSYIKNMVPKK